MKTLEVIKNAFRVPELRKKILMTLLLIVIFRVGCHIAIPGLTADALSSLSGNGLFRFMDLLTGGAFQQVSLFSLGISPYINASIIIQLLTVAIPALERLSKEGGEEGRKKINQITRYVAVGLALFQSIMLYFNIQGSTINLFAASGKFDLNTFLIVVIAFSAGTTFLMWLGEKITEVGIGNGISMLIFAGIVANIPSVTVRLWNYMFGTADQRLSKSTALNISVVIVLLLIFLAVIVAVVWMEGGERKIPVQYAKRVVGRKIYGGQNTHIPLKVNSSGVLPIIFAMSMLQFPPTIVAFMGKSNATKGFAGWINNFSKGDSWWYVLIYALLIVAFTFFYNIVYFDPNDIANNLKKNGGFVPGIRPGQPTADFIKKSSHKLTWFGAIFLAVLAVLPSIVQIISGYFSKDIAKIELWFGGTTVLILVGVALETVKQLEAQLLMRNYKGFLD
ncbi:MAG: preprotein translocase subunit SecY [Clostridia bacterium]|nr:preprotein translocase subunit SecY [Clostridia bacterium]MBR0157619.1 preprotein translocase subunit SecY [Clostridia bacterium]MBR7062408.1 preprotein translocase subunit SecY [Clostridia bacterium]